MKDTGIVFSLTSEHWRQYKRHIDTGITWQKLTLLHIQTWHKPQIVIAPSCLMLDYVCIINFPIIVIIIIFGPLAQSCRREY